eukprot:sb/3470862/
MLQSPVRCDIVGVDCRVFICVSEPCFDSHAFVSWPIWANQSFTKLLRTPKIMLFPVISGFLWKSQSKWGLSLANTTPHDKRRVTTSKNPTLGETLTEWHPINGIPSSSREFDNLSPPGLTYATRPSDKGVENARARDLQRMSTPWSVVPHETNGHVLPTYQSGCLAATLQVRATKRVYLDRLFSNGYSHATTWPI